MVDCFQLKLFIRMKCKIFIIAYFGFFQLAKSQPLRNEWIDYNKTYFKFKVGKNGLVRLSQNTLAAAGLATTPCEQFQLWRNGVQVPILTSIATGVFGASDYIEFWGQQNDGLPDNALYRNPAHQINNQLSLSTDTSTYFLTTNSNISQNLRINVLPNNVASNVLPVETSFNYSHRVNIKDRINRGFAINVGEDVYSSSYDLGEGFSSRDITKPSNNFTIPLGNLYQANTGTATLFAALGGNADKARSATVAINNSTVITQTINSYNNAVYNGNVSLSSFNNGSNNNVFVNIVTTDDFDRIIVNYIELNYQRQFNFGGDSNFVFQLAANSQGHFLQITNFNNNGVAPILYDITNNRAFVGNIDVAGLVRFALPPSTSTTRFVLGSRSSANILQVSSLQSKKYVDYTSTTNQGNYIVISHPSLITTQGFNDYLNYRKSNTGGNWNTLVVDINEITDQFGFGIKKHPLAIRNFLRFANLNFTNKPENVFFIGKAVTYDQYRANENAANIEQLDLVPTFGWPASDALLVSANNDPIAMFPFGRLSAINSQEISDYLQKVQEYEQQAANTTQTIANKLWMKQLVHVAGADDPGLDALLSFYLNTYKAKAIDTLMGATVADFNKTTGSSISPITIADMNKYFTQGINLLTYFGHSAASGLSYNLNDPNDYNNQGKYPTFLVNGCSAGNFFDFDGIRFSSKTSLAEKFIFAKQRGAIAFIASSHFGLTSYLDFYSAGFYKSINGSGYGKSIGVNMADGKNQLITSAGLNDYFGRTHAEQFILHGDPALKIYAHAKPDFVIEDPQVSVTPNFISVADNNFTVKASIYNIGKATGDSVRLRVRRTYPDGSFTDILNAKIKSINYQKDTTLTLPIVALRDKGNNSISITIDSDNLYDELSESNNTVTKNFVIFEDELRPIFPVNYAVVNKRNIKLAASTANALDVVRSYVMEIDTTALFNSPLKATRTLNSTGGLIEFDPVLNFTDSTVYYWRVAPVATSGNNRWFTSSFVFLQNASRGGFNQSHFYQITNGSFFNMMADSVSRNYPFKPITQSLTLRNAVWPYGGSVDEPYSVALNDALNPNIKGICYRPSNLTINVFNPSTLNAKFNVGTGAAGPGQFGSQSNQVCTVTGREYDFAFETGNSTGRKAAMDFLDNQVKDGEYVVVRSTIIEPLGYTFANDWKADEAVFGAGNTIYHKLKNAGFADIDSFNRLRCFVFIYKKNDPSFTPQFKLSNSFNDFIVFRINVTTVPNNGYIASPSFGPASKWYNFLWNARKTNSQDVAVAKIVGIKTDNSVDTLFTYNDTQLSNDISAISAATYPYLKIVMQTTDTANLTPYHLRWWRLVADGLPDAAAAPNIRYTFKDTVEIGEPINFSLAFKNASDINFTDSLQVALNVIDRNNVVQPIQIKKLKPIIAGDTAVIRTTINTQNLSGLNGLNLYVNQANNPVELHQFNNFAFKNFFVRPDDKNPLLDVTFDGVRILNGDIVSSKPAIRIQLRDDSKFLALNDTSLLTLQLKMPDGSIKKFNYGTDTLRFVNANLVGGNNVATIEFNPNLFIDGTYELFVIGKDRSNNPTALVQYRISFVVNNKPMISNLFNYPNPFTTSTAFVFTLTGSKVPSMLRIQILTVTGKVVKEINKNELGNLHIGRNITEYKWDGTDNYGQKLANGVYLYRVICSNDGNSLEKYTLTDSNGFDVSTDQYFKGGYGKMYLMR
jgi:hypothetical protein